MTSVGTGSHNGDFSLECKNLISPFMAQNLISPFMAQNLLSPFMAQNKQIKQVKMTQKIIKYLKEKYQNQNPMGEMLALRTKFL